MVSNLSCHERCGNVGPHWVHSIECRFHPENVRARQLMDITDNRPPPTTREQNDALACFTEPTHPTTFTTVREPNVLLGPRTMECVGNTVRLTFGTEAQAVDFFNRTVVRAKPEN